MGPEIEHLYAMHGACMDSAGEGLAIFQRGHTSPWALRHYADCEFDWDWSQIWPRREWWRDIPWSIEYPEDEPCGGDETILFLPCKRDTPGAYPVTVLWFG